MLHKIDFISKTIQVSIDTCIVLYSYKILTIFKASALNNLFKALAFKALASALNNLFKALALNIVKIL